MSTKIACSLDDVNTLSADEVKGILDADAQGGHILLDVRQPEEYAAGHIPGARLIPLGELEERVGEIREDRPIITYCRSGRRGLGASVLLCGLGFRDVYNMVGGTGAWQHELVRGRPDEGMDLLAEVPGPVEALLLAFRMEKGSWDFYSKVGERLKGKSQVVTNLVNMEVDHMKWIYKELVRYRGEDLPPLETLTEEASGERMEAGVSVNEALLRFEGEVKDDLEVIEAALEMECKAYDLYRRMADAVADEETAQLFGRLAGAERGHIRQLSGELGQFLQDAGPGS